MIVTYIHTPDCDFVAGGETVRIGLHRIQVFDITVLLDVLYSHHMHHGDGAVCGDRGGGETVPETILKSGTETEIPSDSTGEKLSEGI